MLRGRAERPRRQEGGAQRGAQAPAEMQRGAGRTGHGALLLALLILPDGGQLLHQTTVALPVHLKQQEKDQSLSSGEDRRLTRYTCCY